MELVELAELGLPWGLSAGSDSSVSLHRTSGQQAEPPALSSPDPLKTRTSADTQPEPGVCRDSVHTDRQTGTQACRQTGSYLALGTGNHSVHHTPTGQVGHKKEPISIYVELCYCGNQCIWAVCVDLLGCLRGSSVRLELLFPGEPWTHTQIYTGPPG